MATTKEPLQSSDPDIEALLALLGAFIIPIATSFYQVWAQDRRNLLEDRRAVRGHIQNMRASLDTAQAVLQSIEEIIRSADLTKVSIWPNGSHGIQLSREDSDRYIRMIDETVSALRRADEAAMELSSMYIPTTNNSNWRGELEILQALLNQRNAINTYGDSIKHWRRATRIGKNVLTEASRALGDYARV